MKVPVYGYVLSLGFVCVGCLHERNFPSRPATVTMAAAGRDSSPRSTVYDDLEWLVGEWQCFERQALVSTNGESLAQCAPGIIGLIVYYPFSYGEVTLALHDTPDRKILAQFFVTDNNGHKALMDPAQPVMIGKDILTVGYPTPFAAQFRYTHAFDEEHAADLLELRSKSSLWKLRKVRELSPGEKEAAVVMPKDRKLFRIWANDLQRQKFERMNGESGR